MKTSPLGRPNILCWTFASRTSVADVISAGISTYKKRKRKLTCLLSLLSIALLGCYPEYFSRSQGDGGSAAIDTLYTIESLLAQRDENEDLELYLYRHSATKGIIIDFYSKVTGDMAVALPILSHAEKNNITPSLAFSLAWAESRYKITAVNQNAGSIDRGLFQLNSRTFPVLAEGDFYNPEINARHGLMHLRFCLNEGKSEIVALAMYNAGTYGVIRGTPYSTLKYVAQVMEYKENLEEKFQREVLRADRVVTLSGVAGDS
jgi:hypothetical protein